MTRHPAFVALSREHHDGLLLAIRLQQGTRALERLWSHDVVWQAEYVADFFAKNLDRHFKDEENILFPAAAAISEEGSKMTGELSAEHTAMRRLADGLRGPAEGPLAQTLKEFGTILERHIRREERELFPLCETRLSPEKLDALAAALNH